jgi:serine/threonine-protein kinase
VEEPSSLVGAVLASKYRVDSILGVGGMGVVLAATHLQLRQQVAIKLLRTETAMRPDAVLRFLREARVAMKLRGEHVVRVLDVGTLENGAPFIAMECLQGRDLGEVLRADGRLRTEAAVDYVLQACEAIAEAHAAGVIHRDLKPANLFLTQRVDGTPCVKVLDFGISKIGGPLEDLPDPLATTLSDPDARDGPASSARAPHVLAGQSVTRTSAVLGSPRYMAPEQLRSPRDVDVRADVWALGAILFELLAGRPPFEGDTLEAIRDAVTEGPLPPLPGLPSGLHDAIRRCLARDVAQRWPTVADLAEALAPFGSAEGEQSAARVRRIARHSLHGPEPSPARGGRSVRRAVIAASVFALALGAAAVTTRARPAAESAGAGLSVAPPPRCTSHRECTRRHDGVPHVCRASDGTCAAIASVDCEPKMEPGDLDADDTLWIGALFPAQGPAAEAYGRMSLAGADFARKEIAQATAGLQGSGASLHVRRIALVACDDSADEPNGGPSPRALRATHHLVDDLGVPAILGFRSGQEVVELAGGLLIGRGVLSVSTLSANPLVTHVPQPGQPAPLVWSTVFSLDGMAHAIARIVPEVLEPRLSVRSRVVLAREDNGSTLSFAEALSGSLVINGRAAVENPDDYATVTFPVGDLSPAERDKAADAILAARPAIVVVVGNSDSAARLVETVESRWPRHVPRPTYLLPNAWLAPFAGYLGASVERRRRIFEVLSESTSANNARFVARYNAAHQERVTLTTNPSSTYDAVYLLAYSAFALASEPVTGPSLARTIARLVPPGDPIDVGPTEIFDALKLLDTKGRFDLQGAATGLDFDLAIGQATADFALVCPSVDSAGRATGDGVDSGLVVRARAQHVEGTVRCP